MNKLRKITTAALLSVAVLLTGCMEHRTDHAQGSDTNTNTSSDISDSNSSESTDNSSESSGSSYNSTSTKSESSSSDTSDSVSESESSTESDSNSEESSDISADTVPVEFTDEDKELQKILEDLVKGGNTINGWFTNDRPLIFYTEMDSDGNLVEYCEIDSTAQGIELFFSGGSRGTYFLMPDNYSERGMPFPQTYEDAREIVLEYYSERAADNIIVNWVGKGSMTEKPDGTLEVQLENDGDKLIEIDGKMYRLMGLGGKGLGINAINPPSAKIVSKTDDTIEFTYLTAYFYDTDEKGNPKYIDDVSLYEEHAHIGVLKYERGGWRRDWDKDDPRRD